MKFKIVVVLVLVMLLLSIMPAYAQDGTEVFFLNLAVLIAGAGIGVASALIQKLIQQIVPFLGQEEAAKLKTILNSLMALILPFGVGYLLIWVMSLLSVPPFDPQAFIMAILAAIAVSKGTHEIEVRRK